MESVKNATLSKDVFELEKDFRYNLSLLQLQDRELRRCNGVKMLLEQQLLQKERKYQETRKKVHELETNLAAAHSKRHSIKIYYEEKLAELSRKLEDTQKTHDNYIRDQQIEMKKRETELERMCKSILEAKEKMRQQEIAKINERLQTEISLAEKAKTELRNVINENVTLRQELHEKDSNYITKISIIESELKTVQDDTANLQMKYNIKRKDCDYLKTELKKTITEKDQVKQELSDSDERNRNSQRKLKEISAERDHLNRQLNQTSAELKSCLENFETIKQENIQLKTYKKETLQNYNENIVNLKLCDELNAKNNQLQTEFESFKCDSSAREQKLQNDINQLKKQHSKLEIQFNYYKQQIINQDGENTLTIIEKLAEQNLQLSSEIEQYKNAQTSEELNLKSLIEKLRSITEEADMLRTQIDYYKNRSIDLIQCIIPEHSQIDAISKQNAILQEVVKSMRRERGCESLDSQEMEKKIDRLEGVVTRLKELMFNNSGMELPGE